MDDLPALLRLEIAGEAFLVVVDREKGGRHAVFLRQPSARIVAAGGWLDLDDIGAKFTEGQAAQRAGKHFGKINDAQALKETHGFQALLGEGSI